jgi:hypothetical protein
MIKEISLYGKEKIMHILAENRTKYQHEGEISYAADNCSGALKHAQGINTGRRHGIRALRSWLNPGQYFQMRAMEWINAASRGKTGKRLDPGSDIHGR